MPKVPKEMWESSIDPRSPEYNPTKKDLANEAERIDEIHQDLLSISRELRNPQGDDFYGERNEFNVADPEDMWTHLDYTRQDIITLPPSHERTLLEKRAAELEQKIYKHFIPFLESRIARYGLEHSPLTKHPRWKKGYDLEVEDMENYFDQARAAIERFKLSADDHLMYLSELDRLRETLDRYRSEPLLYNFEKIEEDLQRSLIFTDLGSLSYGEQPLRRGLGSERDESAVAEQLQKMLGQAHELKNIADRMLHEDRRERCAERAAALVSYLEHLLIRLESPEELFAIEATLLDCIDRLQRGETIDAALLTNSETQLWALLRKKLTPFQKQFAANLISLLAKATRLMNGETIDEDAERMDVAAGDIDWAWKLLNVTRDSMMEDVKREYKHLARKFHPDRNKSDEALEQMKRINEAFECVVRLLKTEKT